MSALRQRMIEDMQLRGLSERTQESYIRAVRQLAEYYGKSPDQVSEEELRQYFLYLKNEKHASRSTCTLALCGIKFFYEYTLHRDWPTLSFVRPARERKLPVVLSREEVCRILGCLRRPHYRVCLSTIYACGLRLQEGVQLRVADIDGARNLLHVRLGKGAKDRYVPLPERTLEMLRAHWITHRHPVWLFPARKGVTTASGPMCESGVQRAFRAALQESGVQKPATVHTLRHSYGRPFGRLVNISLDMTCHQRQVSSPWQFRASSRSGLVSFQGTWASREGEADPQKANVQDGWEGLGG